MQKFAPKNTFTAATVSLVSGMMFFGVLFFFLGGWLVIISGKLSGKAIAVESMLEDGGILRVLKYILTHNPFTGYRKDWRILGYGLAGLVVMALGVSLAVYFSVIASGPGSR